MATTPPQSWSEEEVRSWLDSNGLGELKKLFAPKKVDGAALLSLTADSVLKDFGVTDFDLRRKLLQALTALKQPPPNPPSPPSSPQRSPPPTVVVSAGAVAARVATEELWASSAKLGGVEAFYSASRFEPPSLEQALRAAGVPDAEKVAVLCTDVARRAEADGALFGTKITAEQAAFVSAYTFDFGPIAEHNPFRLLNALLAERRKPARFQSWKAAQDLQKFGCVRGLLFGLLTALRSLPRVNAETLYRGTCSRVPYRAGDKMTMHGFSSATTDIADVTRNFVPNDATGKVEGTLFIMKGAWGYDLRPFSFFGNEREILLEPENNFKVASVQNGLNGNPVTVVLEIAQSSLLLEKIIPPITEKEVKALRKAATSEEEASRKAAAEEEARRKAIAEEEERRKTAAEEEERRKAIEEEEARRKAAAEEEERRKAAEEEARRKAAAEEEARRKAAAEEERARCVKALQATSSGPARDALLQCLSRIHAEKVLRESVYPALTGTGSAVDLLPQKVFEHLFLFAQDVLPVVRGEAFYHAEILSCGLAELTEATKALLEAEFERIIKFCMLPETAIIMHAVFECHVNFVLSREAVAVEAFNHSETSLLLLCEGGFENEHCKSYTFACLPSEAGLLESWLNFRAKQGTVAVFHNSAATLKEELLFVQKQESSAIGIGGIGCTRGDGWLEKTLWRRNSLFILPKDCRQNVPASLAVDKFDPQIAAKRLCGIEALEEVEEQPEPPKICQTPWCNDTSPEHAEAFMHLPPPLPQCSFDSAHVRDGKITTDFGANVCAWTSLLERACEQKRWRVDKSGQAFREIVQWFEGLRPVHMCSADVLASMVRIATVASLGKLSKLWKTADAIADLVWLRPDIASQTASLNQEQDRVARDFVFWYARSKQAERSPMMLQALTQRIIAGMPADKLVFAFDAFKGVQPLSADDVLQMRAAEGRARNLPRTTTEVLQRAVDETMQSVISLLDKAPGIGYWADKEIGSDAVVFAVLGPHTGNYGDAQVVLVFKPSVLWHPDTFLTPVAAIAYHQGFYCTQASLKLDRSLWMGDAKPWAMGGLSAYNAAKFHPSAQGWAEACALEWIMRIAVAQNRDAASVTLRDVQELLKTADSHTAIEAHLPGSVPLALVDKVLISRDAHQKLPQDAIASLNALFQGRPDSASVVEIVGDTRARLNELMTSRQYGMAQPPPWQSPSGFCFVVRPRMQEHICPLVLAPPTSAGTRSAMRFVAVTKSDELSMTLIDSSGGSRPVTFVLDGVGAHVFEGKHTGAPASGRVLATEGSFNRDVLRPANHLEIALENTHDGGLEATLRHFGISGTFNIAEISAPLRPTAQSQWLVAFSVKQTPAAVWNVVCFHEEKLQPKGSVPAPPPKSKPVSLTAFCQAQPSAAFQQPMPPLAPVSAQVFVNQYNRVAAGNSSLAPAITEHNEALRREEEEA